jgi:hypothetical protein
VIIMKRMVFSLSFERLPYQGRYFYIGAWTALGAECYGALGAGSVSTYASNGLDGNRQTVQCFFVWPRMLETGYLALAGCGKSRICHPEPASFAGEGSAVRKKTKEKQIPHPVQKPNGVRNDILTAFSISS